MSRSPSLVVHTVAMGDVVPVTTVGALYDGVAAMGTLPIVTMP
jgi:hypothetical protein